MTSTSGFLFRDIETENISTTRRGVDHHSQARSDTGGDTTKDTSGDHIVINVDDVVDPFIRDDVVEDRDQSDVDEGKDGELLGNLKPGKDDKRDIQDEVENRDDTGFNRS